MADGQDEQTTSPAEAPAAAQPETHGHEHYQPIARSIELLNFQPGDTIVIRADATTEEEVKRIGQGITMLLQERGLRDVQLLVIPQNLDIKVLNVEQMKRQGWRRANLIDTSFGGGNNRQKRPM